MHRACEVNPEKWQEISVLYDDETYSAIWGNYAGQSHRCLGVRWNGGENDNGYPTQGRNPLWYIEPELVTEVILAHLQTLVRSQPQSESRSDYLNNIDTALQEFRESRIG